MKCDKKHMLLYAVTDRAWVGRQSLYEQTEAALKGGATCVQLREKDLGEEEFLAEAMEIGALSPSLSMTMWTLRSNVRLTGFMWDRMIWRPTRCVGVWETI